jgi:DNA-binding NarL/FixJ family response regulator
LDTWNIFVQHASILAQKNVAQEIAMAVVRALVADDHPMCRQAETAALRATLDGCHIDEAATLADALGLANATDLVLLDLGLPDGHGVAGLLAIVAAAPHARVIVVTGNEAPGLHALIRAAGGSGLVLKSAPITTLITAIQTVSDGSSWFCECDDANPGSLAAVSARMATLSVAERRVLGAMCDGSLNKQIAHRFGLSEITVKQHVKAVLRKLEVLNRTQAAMLMQYFDQSGRLPVA